MEKPIKTIKKDNRLSGGGFPECFQGSPTKQMINSTTLGSAAYRRSKKRPNKGIILKGPRLIQQLSAPVATTIKGFNENMHFNVKTYQWEGNNEDLRRFDTLNAKAPGLIAFISSNEVKVVGDMVFDPTQMCWISIKDEDEDPFEGLDEEERNFFEDEDETEDESNNEDFNVTIKEPRRNHKKELSSFSNKNRNSNNRQKNAVAGDQYDYNNDFDDDDDYLSTSNINSNNTNSTASFQSSTSTVESSQSQQQKHGDFRVGTEFELTEDMMRKLKQGHDRWSHKVRGWFPPGSDEYDTSYLQEIRRMVMKK